MEVKFEFSLQQKVVIQDLNITGKVTDLMIDRDRVQWANVQYLNNHGEIKRIWFRESELEAVRIVGKGKTA